MEHAFNGIDIGFNAAVMTIARKLFPCEFPIDQKAFVRAFLETPCTAVASDY